jgi:hypothetical protein
MMEPTVAPSRPRWWRQALPWVIAGGTLIFMFVRVDFAEVADHLKQAQVGLIVLAFLGYCAVYYLTDVLSFFRTYQRLEIPIGLAETARLRFASYAVQGINGAITEIMTVLYLLRVKRTPVLKSTGAAGFIYFNELLTLLALLTYFIFFLPPENRIVREVPFIDRPHQLWTLLQSGVVLVWMAFPFWLWFWSSSFPERWARVRDAEILAPFASARLRDYLEVFLYRFSNNLISIGANIIILRAMGIKAPASLLFAVVPIMVNAAYLPISAAGMGGPQLVADVLLRHQATEGQILAYSLVWSALFFLTRTLTGLAFLRPVYHAAFPPEGLAPAEDKA